MPPPSTRPEFFATTRWTLIRDAARGGDAEAVSALGDLFVTYWPPLYRYARRQGKSPQDAEDLVQGFFAGLLEQDRSGASSSLPRSAPASMTSATAPGGVL